MQVLAIEVGPRRTCDLTRLSPSPLRPTAAVKQAHPAIICHEYFLPLVKQSAPEQARRCRMPWFRGTHYVRGQGTPASALLPLRSLP